MNKIVSSLKEAVSDVHDGAAVLIGGFGGNGNPFNLTEALVEQGAKDLAVICNDFSQWGPLVMKKQVSRLISGFTAHPMRPEYGDAVEDQMETGLMREVVTVPHGTLEERIRAGGMGIAAFYTPTGVGTSVAEGKESRIFDGKEYILETALKADFALVKGYRADRFGNVVCRLSARNRNVIMATAAQTTIVEVEEIAEVGELDPENIHIQGIFIDRVVKAPKVQRWLVGHEKV
jgi:3-oxoacid CoA-transferase subunit A